MERRLLLVFALTFLVILLFQPLLKKYLPQPPPPQKQTETQPQPVQPSNPPTAVQAQVPTPPAGVIKQASSEAETVVENDLYRITFTNRGGQVKSWILKKFDDDDGKPLELVNKAAAPKYGYPLSLWAYDETLRNKLNSVLYVASGEGTQAAPAEITFEYADQDVAVHKTLRFDHTYVVHVEVSVVSKGSQVTAFPMWPSGFGDETSIASYAATLVEYQNGSNVERVAVKKVGGGATVQGPFNWAGVADQYFAAVFLPEDAQAGAMVTLHNQIDIPKDPQKPQETTKVDVLGAAVGNLHGPTVGRLFVGPKVLNVLESVPVAGMPSNVDPDLRQLVDFGWLGVISRPLFVWLRWTYEKMVGNWGWAIAIQTLIINLTLLPLRISSMKSALKMQKIQPQMNSIKEKYKKYSLRDPRRQEMNTEIGALMKQEGVSPVGGCLPLLIQMPFLFAYYRMLGVAIDLRHAHWLWIRDLSSADPWHILPIAIIITMLFTQRMTPQAGMDPAQQKMMNLLMPLMLGVISWNLAAGLCLYWSEGNLIAIAQQAIMNKTQLGREMREMMLKRAKKKDKDK
ncbi:MAG: membrane protein insertase YidC [Acidobacteriia bacterium]|nr:membrane protein insertase YidC [Terriglobia bacterium]